MIVLVTGATGLVGGHVTRMLTAQGHEVRSLSRSKGPFLWDPAAGRMDESALQGVDAVVHLAGENIAGRWTAARKRAIVDSRQRATALLARALARSAAAGKRPVVVAASAIGFYGDRGDELVNEESAAGTGFLADTTLLWEKALSELSDHSSRSVILRIGVVLDRHLGALPKMAQPVKFFAGAPLGSGRQFISWIHVEDLARIVCLAVDPSFEKDSTPGQLSQTMQGIFNAAAPNPVTNKQMTEKIAHALGRPQFLPAVPAFVLKALLGDMSMLVLESTRVSCQKLLELGFRFRFPDLEGALNNLLGRR